MSPGGPPPSVFFPDATSNRAAVCWPDSARLARAATIPSLRAATSVDIPASVSFIILQYRSAITDADAKSEEADPRGAGLPQTRYSLLRHHHIVEGSRRTRGRDRRA